MKLHGFETLQWVLAVSLLSASPLSLCVAATTPPGFVKSTIPLNAPPVALAFDEDGVLYALEAAIDNAATLRTFLPDGTASASFTVTGDDPDLFFVGGMAYDPVGERLLISDNTADGRLYAVSKAGVQAAQPLATGLAGIASVAVRSTGEIFVTTAPFGNPGAVVQVEANGETTEVLGGLGFGAGLAFDAGDLLIQDGYFNSQSVVRGRLRILGETVPLLEDMQSSYSVIVDSEGDIFTTGSGGLFEVKGTQLAEVSFLSSQFAAAMAFDPGPFEKFAGPGGGRLALAADAFGIENKLVTILTPAEPGDYNADGHVTASDYAAWLSAYGSANLSADGNNDEQIDAADYVVWRQHFQPSSENTSAALATIVPEPMSVMLILISLAVGAFNHRRLRK